MNYKHFFAIMMGVCAGSASAVTITVAPTTGVENTLTAKTIANAIVQINAGADVNNSIILSSTEGAHVQAEDTAWAFNAGKSVDFTALSGQPVVVLQSAGARYMLAVDAGTNANNQIETLTFSGIAFVPEAGLSYINNIADGFDLGAGNYVFNNCVFSANDGANGVFSQEGDVAFTDVNCVGDDWFQMNGSNDLTFSNCAISGAYDDAILIAGAIAPEISTLLLNEGTCVANNGGAGIQVFGSQTEVVLDGEAGRVLIADNGKRTGANDTGIKYFHDVAVSLVMNKADIVGHNNGGIFDFEGAPLISITNSRVALNNADGIATAGNLSVVDTAASGVGDSAGTVQAILLDNVTFHDALGDSPNNDSIFGNEGASQPAQGYTILDSIFSGAGDTFVNMTNGTNSVAPSPAPIVSTSAVVTAGPHAIADAGELGAGAVNSDPLYVSTTYTVGRNQENPDFLRPTEAAYLTASSTGGPLGGAPTAASVDNFMLY